MLKGYKKYKFPLLNYAKIVYNVFKVCIYALKSGYWNYGYFIYKFLKGDKYD